jgi:Tol biopolymer transport system component
MTDATERLSTALEGRYRVLRRLGEGGMALVYLAEDVKHHRQVALKILRPELAAALGAERFLREIQIAARLTHPNILPLLDSGDADGTLFYVMPFVEGESLRERLVREGPLPVDEAVKLAARVAGALGHAHSLGIVHRDIKPENILLSGGEPVVADFGIAKAVSEAGQTKLTESGFAVGTAPYMSPEQASAEAQVDGRSDIYALGCVLYEMLAGAPPFSGRTLHAITARKLTEPVPPLRAVRETVPALLEQVVFTALAKLPADRFATAGQMAEALESARTSPVTPSAPVAAFGPAVPGRWRRALPWVIATGLSVIAAVAGLRGWRAGADASADLHLSVTTPRGTEVYGLGPPLALSPDGMTLVFAAGRNDSVRLYARRLDSFETRALPGTEGGDSPFFSPDGRWVGFFARKERQLRKVALAGGSPETIAEDLGAIPQAGVWGTNDTIYFANFPDIQISKVAASGGTIASVTHGNPPNGWFRLPLSLTPDGSHAVVLVNGSGLPSNSHLDLVSLVTGEHRLLLRGVTEGRLVSGRYLLYLPWDHNEVRAVAYDGRNQAVAGDPVTVLDSVAVYPTGPLYLASAPNGTLAYVPLTRWLDPNAWEELVLVGRDGRAEPRRLPQGDGPRFSPDGRRLVYAGAGRHDADILLYDLASGVERHLTGEGAELWPIFSHDGRSAVFNSAGGQRAGTLLLYVAPADGSGHPVRLPTDTLNHQQPFTWAARGRELLYTEGPGPGGDFDLWVAPLAGGGTAHPLMHTSANETQPAVSPDGRWLAWATDASGRFQVMVRRYPDGPDVPVSRDGGVEPAWSPDGREIYFRDLAGTRMMVVSFQPGDPPQVGAPRVLFKGRYQNCAIWCRSYDVSPDGRRFVMVKLYEGFTDTGYWPDGGEIRIVPHWDRELRVRMRTAKR